MNPPSIDKRASAALVMVALVFIAACGHSLRCPISQIVAADKCFETAEAACAAAGCTRDKCDILESAPAQASCRPDR